MKFKVCLFLLIVNLKQSCYCLELFSGAIAVAGTAVLSTSLFMKCKYFECCDDSWIHFKEKKLDDYLKKNVFGQHIADIAVMRTFRGFYKNKNPKKALTMAFHGLTGSGKNYIANMIANSTYEKGTESSYVHIYSGVKDFPHKSKVSEYKDRLQRDIISFTKQCGRSLFIFDEVDKMPPGVLDSLTPFIDYYEYVDGTDYRRNVFIFLSNSGSSGILSVTLKFWAEGREREEIQIRDIESWVNKGAFNEQGGFQFSELLRKELIDVYVPFLPLEKKHVRKCIERELENRGKHVQPKLVNDIADELIYFPPEEELYSKSGCKRIQQKIDLYID